MPEENAGNQERKLSAITRLQYSIGLKSKLEEVARILVEELVNIVGCSGCAMLLIEGSKVRILAEKGFPEMLEQQEFSTDVPAIEYMASTKQCICTGDSADGSAFHFLPARCSMKSLMCAPVVVSDKVKGIVCLDSTEENAFDKDDLRFVQLLAKGMSIAMERSFLHSQVKVLTTEDSLTGCHNRRKFEADLEEEIARAKRYERPLSFLMIDIDWFKKYNDIHGHSKGDELLKEIAKLFVGKVRDTDKVYRYGGEVFVIMLPETDQEKALLVANRIQKAVEQKQFAGQKESQPDGELTVSIGVASYPWDGNSKNELLESADTALRHAKRSGRNCVFGKKEKTVSST